MTTNEFYYLMLVLGAFATFGIAMSVATIQYKAWLRQTGSKRIATAPLAADLAGAV